MNGRRELSYLSRWITVGTPFIAFARMPLGPVSAASLLKRYGTLEKLLATRRFSAQADKLRLYKSIATMDKSAPLPPLRNQKPTWGDAADLARSWDLEKLAERLDALATT